MPKPDRASPSPESGLLPLELGRHRQARTFFGAPQSVARWVAAVLEPMVSVLTLVGLLQLHGTGFPRWATAMSLMVIALTFPGRMALKVTALQLAVAMARNWVLLLSLLFLCGYALGVLQELDWTLLTEWALATPMLHWAAHLLWVQQVRRHAERHAHERSAVIVGGGPLGLRTAAALANHAEGSARVIGYFDDRCGQRLAPAARHKQLGGLAEVCRYVEKLGIREVYITLPMAANARLVALVESLQCTTASIFVVPDLFSAQIVQGRLKELDGLAVVGICESPFTGVNEVLKRLSDIVIACLLLLLTGALVAIIVAFLSLTGRGPTWVRQRRSGLNGEEIILYRLRTGPPIRGRLVGQGRDADAGRAGSPRLDRCLQRTGLDGWPQLFNVLQGRLSMVGPLAQPMADSRAYQGSVPAYMVRYKARPGITGWAQVNHAGGDGSSMGAMRHRVELDLAYLRNWSLALDLHILLLALRQLIGRRAVA
jgi:putative colanic acid biosynthesis UDP-glucose lipid carrier transferase